MLGENSRIMDIYSEIWYTKHVYFVLKYDSRLADLKPNLTVKNKKIQQVKAGSLGY